MGITNFPSPSLETNQKNRDKVAPTDRRKPLLASRVTGEKGIKKKVFRNIDPELCFASIIGTIHHLMHSTILRKRIFGGKEKKDPILEPSFKKRVTKHIQQMIEHHLIAEKNNNN